jgi:hypothetical protein
LHSDVKDELKNTAFLTAITTTSCMGHGPIALI